MFISSEQNQRIKDLVKLQEKKYRDKLGKFVAETYYPILYAIDSQYTLETLYFCPSLYKDKEQSDEIVALAQKKNLELIEVSKNVFEKMAYVKSYDGLLAVGTTKVAQLTETPTVTNGLYLILESIEQVSDLGTLIRLADTSGATAVIVCDQRTDIFNPGVIRSSLGTVFTVPIFHSTTTEAIAWCKNNDIATLATTPHTTKNYTTVDFHKSVAVLMGNEYTGLSDAWMKEATEKILIPMLGKANSLSVVTSAAIVLYEAVRQRTK